MTGFNIDQLENAIRSGTNTDQVRLCFGAYLNITTPAAELRARCPTTTDVGTASANRVSTVRELLEHTGAVEKIRRIEEQLRSKGHPVSEGLSISIVDSDGETVLESTDISEALSHELNGGDTVSVLAKVSGR